MPSLCNPNHLSDLRLTLKELLTLKEYLNLDSFDLDKPYVIIEMADAHYLFCNFLDTRDMSVEFREGPLAEACQGLGEYVGTGPHTAKGSVIQRVLQEQVRAWIPYPGYTLYFRTRFLESSAMQYFVPAARNDPTQDRPH